MDEKWQFLVHREHRDFRGEPHRDIQVVLDLGAAPGGWSQVVSQKLGWDTLKPARYSESSDGWSAPTPSAPHNPLDISDVELLGRGQGTTIAVDLLPMIPIPGVQFIQADFLAPDTEALIRSIIANQTGTAGKADVILCDMASNSMGNVFHDIESSLAICTSVFEFSKRHLRSAESVGRDMGGVLLSVPFRLI
jgi:23S rRNA (uridine2552-2'-O)-methyltransferase